MTDIVDPGTINNGDTPDWDLVQAYFDAIYDVINSPGELTNANIDPAAAIAYSKLNLSNSIVAGDIASGAVGAAELDALPACILAQTSSIAQNNTSVETFAAESIDTDTMHSTSVNTSRITIVTAGIYRIEASALFNDTLAAGNIASVELRLNGSTIDKNAVEAVAQDFGGDVIARPSISATFPLAAAQYFEVLVYHDTVGSFNATVRLSAVYEGPSS